MKKGIGRNSPLFFPKTLISIICEVYRIAYSKYTMLLLCSLWWVQIVGYFLACWSCSFVCTWHHLIIIIVQTYLQTLNLYKMPVRYILSSVWARLSIFSQLSIIPYMGPCVFSFPISLVTIERIYTLSYYHHQIGSMNYYPLFRVRSWNNGIRCMSLYVLM